MNRSYQIENLKKINNWDIIIIGGGATGLGIAVDSATRGFYHSIFFAVILALIVMLLFFREDRLFSKTWILKLVFFSVITASHGILDALTNGGLGIALLAPFDNTRYFFPYRPIPVSPIGIGSFLSGWGAAVLFAEIVCIWGPIFLIVYLKKLYIKIRTKYTR